ncbi:nuclease-related domain-containing DEAD/DEAH box helicase [Aeromonas bestiarum]|uniref:nuclease-related domain-containing DEAD/DEAH box helicase n=1 Tax=Aeromonas bestiarum TaxID=105751 RepID=UPI0032B2E285
MTRLVSPPKAEHHKLRQPLTPGERMVFEFFDTHLPEHWDIYLQPHLNGLRPDIVLLSPKIGIAVFEIKDWDLDAMQYWVETEPNRSPRLMGRKDGKSFSLQSKNPIGQVDRYKQEIFELYCPRLESRRGFGAITAGVIFPFADDAQIAKLFRPCLEYRQMDQYPQLYPVSGRSALREGDMAAVFPKGKSIYSPVMNDDMYKDLRNWLVEPDFSEAQRRPLELDKEQRALVTSRTASGYRRIKGAAGSGKSLVLAARAAELISQGKQVLVVTFNITLLHYLMDIAVRWPGTKGKTRSCITWLNFHAWCKRVCEKAGFIDDYLALFPRDNSKVHKNELNHVLNHLVPALVESVIQQDSDGMVTCYDAILVDEGQDFLPHWWSVLRQVLNPGGEMLLVADSTQDIYDMASRWTDEAMSDAGFSGRWSELSVSYRLPQRILDLVQEFAQKFLPAESINLPKGQQLGLDLEQSSLKWVQIDEGQTVDTCCTELLNLIKYDSSQPLAIADLTFLCSHKSTGKQVTDSLAQKGIKVINTYDDDERQCRRQKVGFYMGDARVKATTLHSFKGWESRAIVICIGGKLTKTDLALFYTGLTRLKRHTEGSFLTVVSSAPQLREFGQNWPVFESLEGVMA